MNFLDTAKPTGNSHELLCECPDCGKWKLYWNTKKNVGFCQRCQERKMGISYVATSSEGYPTLITELTYRGPDFRLWFPVPRMPLAEAYLRYRGVVPEEAEELEIKATANHGQTGIRFGSSVRWIRRRISDEQRALAGTRRLPGEVVQRWSGPDTEGWKQDGDFLYRNWLPPGKRTVWTLPDPRVPGRSVDDRVVLVEGQFDAIRVWRAGFRSRCLFGKGCLLGSISALGSFVVFLDADATGASEALSLQLASQGYRVHNRTPALKALGRKDPDECTEEELREILR